MATSEFGKLVKKALIDRDMSQMELAKRIGTSPRYVGHIFIIPASWRMEC